MCLRRRTDTKIGFAETSLRGSDHLLRGGGVLRGLSFFYLGVKPREFCVRITRETKHVQTRGPPMQLLCHHCGTDAASASRNIVHNIAAYMHAADGAVAVMGKWCSNAQATVLYWCVPLKYTLHFGHDTTALLQTRRRDSPVAAVACTRIIGVRMYNNKHIVYTIIMRIK